jgi:uncharacterized SAM-binding protein YcdF (DUF218 family)
MFLLKKIAAALILPPAGLVLAAFFGLWVARRHPRAGRAIAALALLALLVLSLPLVSNALVRTLEGEPPVSEQNLARAQAIVILGAGTYHGAPEYGGADTVNPLALERLRYGAALQKRSALPILVTGGSPFGGRPEGEAMKEVIERDFYGKVQWVERESRDTAENAVYSARLLKHADIERVALVSHAWHLRRASAHFRAQGLEVIAAPTGYATRGPELIESLLPSARALAASSRALTEWLGILVAGG